MDIDSLPDEDSQDFIDLDAIEDEDNDAHDLWQDENPLMASDLPIRVDEGDGRQMATDMLSSFMPPTSIRNGTHKLLRARGNNKNWANAIEDVVNTEEHASVPYAASIAAKSASEMDMDIDGDIHRLATATAASVQHAASFPMTAPPSSVVTNAPHITQQDPRQFSTDDHRHEVLLNSLNQLVVNSLIRCTEDEDQSPNSYVTQFVHKFADVLNIVERAVPPPSATYRPTDSALPHLPTISRSYIRNFLRAAVPELGEQECSLGDECVSVGMCISKEKDHGSTGHNNKFTFKCRRFLTPAELSQVYVNIDTGMTPTEAHKTITPGPCVLDTRFLVQQIATAIGGQLDPARKSQYPTIVQSYSNMFDCEGEYRSDTAMLLAGAEFHGLIEPVVQFNARHYTRNMETVEVSETTMCAVNAWTETSDLIFVSNQASKMSTSAMEATALPSSVTDLPYFDPSSSVHSRY